MNATITKESRVLKVILLGDGGVGKSSIMNRFINNKFDALSYHTIGVEFLNKDIIIDDVLYTLQIWDTAGQERFRALRIPFYRGSDICLLTYAVDDPDSFRNLDMWQNEFLNYGDIPPDQPFPFLLLGNKCDLPSDEWLVPKQRVLEWCSNGGSRAGNATLNRPLTAPSPNPVSAASSARHSPPGTVTGASKLPPQFAIPLVETSAKDAINVKEGFQQAVQLWRTWDRAHNNQVLPRNDSWHKSSVKVGISPTVGRSNSNSCCKK